MTDPRLLLAAAEESFDAAGLLLKGGFPRAAASRTYYGYFYIAKVLLQSRGFDFSSHGQVVGQYGFHFARTGVLDPVFHNLLGSAFELRSIGDYQITRPVEPETVEELIAGGKRFLAAALEFLARPQGPPDHG